MYTLGLSSQEVGDSRWFSQVDSMSPEASPMGKKAGESGLYDMGHLVIMAGFEGSRKLLENSPLKPPEKTQPYMYHDVGW